jgi:hypothetical protein
VAHHLDLGGSGNEFTFWTSMYMKLLPVQVRDAGQNDESVIEPHDVQLPLFEEVVSRRGEVIKESLAAYLVEIFPYSGCGRRSLAATIGGE